jgi:hypothetical protein
MQVVGTVSSGNAIILQHRINDPTGWWLTKYRWGVIVQYVVFIDLYNAFFALTARDRLHNLTYLNDCMWTRACHLRDTLAPMQLL